MTTSPLRARAGIPQADCAIDAALVRTLLTEQHPDLAQLPIEFAAQGWDNEMYRLGADLAVRLPRRAAAAPLVVKEQRWLAHVAAGLPLRAPVPLRVGRPGGRYPYAWSVIPWLAGTAADVAAHSADAATVLASFLRALHRPAAADAPLNPVRGGPLSGLARAMEARLERLDAQLGRMDAQPGRMDAQLGRPEARLAHPHGHRPAFGATARLLWQRAVAAPIDTPMAWIHGDLHAQNVLVDSGAWCAVIDWGDMAAGDPATDLAAIWMLIPDRHERERAIGLYGASAAAVLRAKGWALNFAAIFLDAGLAADARLARMGQSTLLRVLEDT